MVCYASPRFGPAEGDRQSSWAQDCERNVSPQERLALLEREQERLIQRQEQLFQEVMEGDDSGSSLLALAQRLRYLASEIQVVRAACG